MPNIVRASFLPLFVVLASLGTTFAPAEGAPVARGAARAITSLSADERLHLPDATLIDLVGRNVSLGTLRHEHDRRMNRLAHPAMLNAPIVRRALGTLNVVDQGNLVTQSPSPGATQPTTILRLPASYFVQFASDYEAYCGFRIPCLYVPPYTTLNVQGRFAYDVDPMIFDAQICGSGGGTMQRAGCYYKYPLDQLINYTPPLVLDDDGWFDGGGFTYQLDPRGALELKIKAMPANGSWYSTGYGSNCWVVGAILDSSAQSVQAR